MPAIKTSTRGSILIVELPGPGANGRANAAFQEDLAAAWRRLDDDETLRLGVLHGASGAYNFALAVQEGRAAGWGLPALPLHAGAPVIAAIEGECYGAGFELALACDLRIAGEGSSFACPESMGPYRVASVLLPRVTFAGLGMELLLTDRKLTAAEAQQARLVTDVVPGRALDAAIETAEAMLDRIGPSGFKKQRILALSGVPLVTAMGRARRP